MYQISKCKKFKKIQELKEDTSKLFNLGVDTEAKQCNKKRKG